jgi:predicted nucleic acid-binding protein
MSERVFVDTNILVYAHDRSAGTKHELARQLLERLWEERSAVISTQVLQELYVNLRRQAAKPLSRARAAAIIEDYLSWEVVINDGKSILEALEIERAHRLSFWDALIVQAAIASRAEVLYSEDLNDGQRIAGVRVRNPLQEVL